MCGGSHRRNSSVEHRSRRLPPMAAEETSSYGDGSPLSTAFQASYAHPLVLRWPDPPTFSGLKLDDADERLDDFKRISRYNRWSAGTQLNSVIFSLFGVARTWFFYLEADFEDLTMFSIRFRDLIGRPASCVAEVQQNFSFRAQH